MMGETAQSVREQLELNEMKDLVDEFERSAATWEQDPVDLEAEMYGELAGLLGSGATRCSLHRTRKPGSLRQVDWSHMTPRSRLH